VIFESWASTVPENSPATMLDKHKLIPLFIIYSPKNGISGGLPAYYLCKGTIKEKFHEFHRY